MDPIQAARIDLAQESPFLKELWNTPVNLEKQSVEVGTAESPDETAPRRSARFPNQLVTELFPGVGTCYASFERAVSKYGDRPCMGYREVLDEEVPAPAPVDPKATPRTGDLRKRGNYVWQSYKEIHARVSALGSAIRGAGISRGKTVGIYGKNSIEWVMAMEACHAHSLVSVAIYDTFGPENIEYVLNHAEVSLVFCSFEGVGKLISIAPKLPSLKYIVQFDSNKSPVWTKDVPAGVTFLKFSEFEAKGRENPVPADPPAPTDIALIMYTSGTTGQPKGVIHTHRSLVCTMAAVSASLNGVTCEDCYISYLPLAHILEREAMTAMLAVGASVGFYQGDVAKLVEDIELLKPTVMAGVPRVYERVMARIKGQIETAGGLKQALFNAAFDYKKSYMPMNIATPLTDWVVFRKTKERLGGRIRLIVSGGAPLSPPTQEFIKICFCAPVVQGYGLTETCAAGAITLSDDPKFGHTGPPVPSVEIKLVSVPDMGYLASNGTGEIAIRGPSLSAGYYKDEEKTKADFRAGGWFFTGDIGRWNPNGTLSIIDRVKNFFKLSQGEYVAAEKLELIYARCKLVAQIFVYGDSFETCIVAVVVPNKEMVLLWAKNKGLPEDYQAILSGSELKKELLDSFKGLAKEQGLAGFELIKDLHIHPDEWTVEQDLVTPTMKLRRPQLKKFFDKEIKTLYANIPKN